MKNIGLVIIIILLIGLVAYLYLGLTECKNTATEIGMKLQECGTGLEMCATQAADCQEILINLEAVCAPFLSQEIEE